MTKEHSRLHQQRRGNDLGRRTRQYLLDKKRLAYHNTFSHCAGCIKCGKTFNLGDTLVSKKSGNTGTKYYHADCWESLFV